MNALESYTIDSPYGKSDECAKLSIVDTAEWFIFSDTTTTGLVYTFSAWVKSDAEGSFTVGESYFLTSTEWRRCKATFTADSIDLKLIFDVPGTYYLYNTQLEIGTIATDWSPAPEDHTDEMETRFSIEAGKIEAEFETVRTTINELGERVTERYLKNITEDENGITITDSDDIYSIQVDNVEGVTIRKDGEIRSQLKDDNFHTGNIVVKTTERAQFGNFAFVPRSDGSISFLKVGD